MIKMGHFLQKKVGSLQQHYHGVTSLPHGSSVIAIIYIGAQQNSL